MSDGRDTNDARSDYLLMGEVIRNDDPEKRGRIQVLVKGVYDPDSVWVEALFRMFGVRNGIWWVPEVGSNVAVWLHQGDQGFPFYIPGPFGAPAGVTDVMEQVPDGSVDHMSVRWRDFHVTFNGKTGEEKLTVEDLDSGTKIEIDRPSGGNYVRDVENDETINVANDRSVTVEGGDETHEVTVGDQALSIPAGKRTTTINGDDTKTLATGDDITNLTLGNETKTIAVGSSTESMPAGNKAITAGLAITLTAGGAITLTAGGAASIVGSSVTMNSGGGPSTYLAGGVVTKTFLGGILDTVIGGVISSITGAFVRTIVGAYTLTVSGIFAILAATIQLGNGPFKRLATEDFVLNIYNAHTHGGVQAGGSNTAIPNQLGTATEMTSETTAS